MYRTAASRLRVLKGRTNNGVLKRFATSSATAVQSSSGGIFSWLTGGKSSSLPPLDFPLNDVTIPPPLPDYNEIPMTKRSKLQNGLIIASEPSASPAASIGLFVDCGSIDETPASFGATHLLERMAFKSTLNRSHFRVVREVEATGGCVSAAASREQMIYTYDALKTYVPQMVELLIDSVRNPAFLDWEVKEQIEKLKDDITEYTKNPQHLLLEAVHSAAYAGEYGNPLLASESAANRLNSAVLEDFVSKNYTASRMVLAASGVEHDELLKYASPLLSDLPNGPRTKKPRPVYVGGDYRRQADEGTTHFALAFEVPGGWLDENKAMTATVLQVLLGNDDHQTYAYGGGGSFSAGGPGKGMFSRLYLRVLNEYPQMQMFSAFTSIYNTSGIFGVQATTSSDFANRGIDVAIRELVTVATPGEVELIELDRAKQATKSAILMNLESRMVTTEDMAKQISVYGERRPVREFLRAIDAVTLQDITSLAQIILKSPLTMASYGDVLSLPNYDAVRSKFQ